MPICGWWRSAVTFVLARQTRLVAQHVVKVESGHVVDIALHVLVLKLPLSLLFQLDNPQRIRLAFTWIRFGLLDS